MRPNVRYARSINYKGEASMTASRLRTFVFVTGALMAGAIVQAQQPAQSSIPAASAAATTAASQSRKTTSDSKAAGTQPIKTATAQKPADSNARLIRDARNAGFRPEMIRSTQMFCRTAVELGSNFPVRTCYDTDQVKIKIQEYQTQRNQLEQMHSTGLMTH